MIDKRQLAKLLLLRRVQETRHPGSKPKPISNAKQKAARKQSNKSRRANR